MFRYVDALCLLPFTMYPKTHTHFISISIPETWLKWTQGLMILDLFAYSAAVALYSQWMTKPTAFLQKHGLGWAGAVSTGSCIVAGLVSGFPGLQLLI